MREAVSVLNGLVQRGVREKPGDYRDDQGVLRCGVCGAPREFVDPEGKRFPALCECETIQRDFYAKVAKQKERQTRCYSPLTKSAGSFCEDNGKQPKMEIVLRYTKIWGLAKSEGTGLLLWGDTGTGKSFAAGCVVGEIIRMGASARMITTSEIVLELSDMREGKANYIRNLCNCDLLVLDDYGAERSTEYGQDIIYSVVDTRYRSGKAMIVTTNLSLHEMKNCTNIQKKRLYDRILERCVPVHFDGESHRRKLGESRLERFKEQLYRCEGNSEGEC